MNICDVIKEAGLDQHLLNERIQASMLSTEKNNRDDYCGPHRCTVNQSGNFQFTGSVTLDGLKEIIKLVEDFNIDWYK